MFSKDSMTIAEAQLLVLFALNEYKEELKKTIDNHFAHVVDEESPTAEWIDG